MLYLMSSCFLILGPPMRLIFTCSVLAICLSACTTTTDIQGTPASTEKVTTLTTKTAGEIPGFTFSISDAERNAGRETAVYRCLEEEREYRLKHFGTMQYQTHCYGILNLRNPNRGFQQQRAEQLSN